MTGFATIPGFQKMSKQRIFNLAVAHIAKTRKPSKNSSGNCSYVGSGCNAAPLLQKNKRSPMDKIGSWGEMVDKGAVPATNADFIQQLQDAHDTPANSFGGNFMADWKYEMTILAKRFNLSTSTLDKVPA